MLNFADICMGNLFITVKYRLLLDLRENDDIMLGG